MSLVVLDTLVSNPQTERSSNKWSFKFTKGNSRQPVKSIKRKVRVKEKIDFNG